ncbi:MAG TPA: ABC transporter ATP-binding protein, partial [Lentisphaerae bacterium]|nr:ABC transporter ATP-binding protein [Lentisphaerota bacterium]
MVYGLADIARASLFPHRYRSPHLRARLNDAEALDSERAAGGASSGGPRRTDVGTLRRSEFWALRDVSFQLRRGECLGLIGPNGAGKSTLFSILSGIYEPTRGRAVIRGRLQALIALGAGFHPMLSGRENIYVNGAVFGLTSREIDRLVDRIIEFSELGEFIDAPIKTYSSGMLVRLGFSVAAHLDPDILLVDEVLAVGDARFQLKCLDHMRRLINSGKAQMLVSHYMHNIQGLCDRVIWLDQGRIKAEGPADEVTRRYTEFMYRAGDDDRAAEQCEISGYPALIRGVEVERTEPRGERGQATGRLR